MNALLLACPACAAGAPADPVKTALTVALVLLPFAVAAVGGWWIHRSLSR